MIPLSSILVICWIQTYKVMEIKKNAIYMIQVNQLLSDFQLQRHFFIQTVEINKAVWMLSFKQKELDTLKTSRDISVIGLPLWCLLIFSLNLYSLIQYFYKYCIGIHYIKDILFSKWELHLQNGLQEMKRYYRRKMWWVL